MNRRLKRILFSLVLTLTLDLSAAGRLLGGEPWSVDPVDEAASRDQDRTVKTSYASNDEQPDAASLSSMLQSSVLEKVKGALSGNSPLPASELVTAQQLGQNLSIAEWLGPMAPIALSPFFGITCLSGLALFGGGWIPSGNPLLGTNTPLNSPIIFWTFLGLTILTSLPRLAKVSKPFAQAVDQIEAWSGLLTMLLVKYLLNSSSASAELEPAVAQAGLVEFSAETLLMLAAAMNILVINTVKFFFEILIWLTPIPMLDAVFEASNKVACAAMTALYAWSPVVASILNLVLFLIALCVFGWAHRREVFFRNMLLGMLKAALGWRSEGKTLTAFPVSSIGTIPVRGRCQLRKTPDGWALDYRPWFGAIRTCEFDATNSPKITRGYLTNTVVFQSPALALTFAKCTDAGLAFVVADLVAEVADSSGSPAIGSL